MRTSEMLPPDGTWAATLGGAMATTVAPATPTQTAATAQFRRNTPPRLGIFRPPGLADGSRHEPKDLEMRTRSFHVAKTINISTKARPSRKPYSCARWLSGFPRMASAA